MSALERLRLETRTGRDFLQSAPVIQRALAGDVTRELYVAFLTQAFHHVRHTVPLLMAVGSRLTSRHGWLQKELVHYIEEEVGHEEWVLRDIEAAGGDPRAVRGGSAAIETEAMIAYAYDTVMRGAPVGFFGMVHVLEGTSVALALSAADSIQKTLTLPDCAFSYLRSHGTLDKQHVGHLASILDRLDPGTDIPAVAGCARGIYFLYGSMFRALEREPALVELSGNERRQRA
jgi:pyrroloquinoline quinone (PQQ) biosynthesis protein C